MTKEPTGEEPETEGTETGEPESEEQRERAREARAFYLGSLMLFVPAAFAAWDAFQAIVNSRLVVKGHGTVNGAKIADVVVNFNGAWWEHALLALPYVVMGVAMIAVCRALFRIQINVETHSRPFTPRDARVLWWAPVFVMVADVLSAFVGVRVPKLLPSADGLNDPVTVDGYTASVSFWALTLMLVLFQMHRIHVKARQVHERMEKANERLEEVA